MNVQFLVRFKKYCRSILQIRESCQLISGTYEWLNAKRVAYEKLMNESAANCAFSDAWQDIQKELEEYNKNIESLNITMMNMYKNQTLYDNLSNCVPNVGFYSNLRNLVIRADSIMSVSAAEMIWKTSKVGSRTRILGESSPEMDIIREKNTNVLHMSHRERQLVIHDVVEYVNDGQKFQTHELIADNSSDAELGSRCNEEMDSIQAQKALKRSESETAEIEAQYELKNDQRIIEIISDDEV